MATYRWRVCDEEGCITLRARTEVEALNMAAASMSPRGPLRAELVDYTPGES